MASVSFNTNDSDDMGFVTEVPKCIELMIDRTGTIYTPNLSEINELFHPEFKQMCKLLAQEALTEMRSPRNLQ